MSVVAVCVICLCAAILAVILKQYKPEYAILITITAGCGVLLLIIYAALPIMDKISELSKEIGSAGEYITVILKAVGICYIAQFAADACRDAGENSLAGKIELGAKVSIVALSLPLLSELLTIVLMLTDL